jgi:protein-tyrosine phosphatase
MTGMSRTRQTPPIGVLFVCMGNICRSPLAEGLFLHKADRRGVGERFLVDSAGTGDWHAGERPDRRARKIAASHGLTLSGRARQVTHDDLHRFDHLVCMDEGNRRDLLHLGAPRHKLRLLMESDPSTALCEVPDPYYEGRRGFEAVYDLLDSACEALLDELLAAVQ